jgi:hypothetical protein
MAQINWHGTTDEWDWIKKHKEELSKEIVDIVNDWSDSDDRNQEFIADNVIYGRRNGKQMNAEKMIKMGYDAEKAMEANRQSKHEEIINRYANEVTDAVVNGEPQKEVMKKAMDFTKEIDELKEKETHWDKEPGMIKEHSSDFYDAQWASAEENKRRLDATNEALKCESLTWEPTFADKYAREFLSKLNDPVSHPAHYTTGKIECIEYIEDKGLGFHLGNAVKYITRAGKKSPDKKIEDLRKAMWYIDRYIQIEEKREREETAEMIGNRTE